MYCPKCAQYAADTARFCSSCGFHLSAVSQLLPNNGLIGAPLVASQPQPMPPSEDSPRRKGTKLGVKLMLLAAVLKPIFFALAIGVDEPVPLLVPATVFLAGLAWLLYARFFRENYSTAPAMQPAMPQYFPPPINHYEQLPPPSVVPVTNYAPQRVTTSELAAPMSVTESTTKLLEKK